MAHRAVEGGHGDHRGPRTGAIRESQSSRVVGVLNKATGQNLERGSRSNGVEMVDRSARLRSMTFVTDSDGTEADDRPRTSADRLPRPSAVPPIDQSMQVVGFVQRGSLLLRLPARPVRTDRRRPADRVAQAPATSSSTQRHEHRRPGVSIRSWSPRSTTRRAPRSEDQAGRGRARSSASRLPPVLDRRQGMGDGPRPEGQATRSGPSAAWRTVSSPSRRDKVQFVYNLDVAEGNADFFAGNASGPGPRQHPASRPPGSPPSTPGRRPRSELIAGSSEASNSWAA